MKKLLTLLILVLVTLFAAAASAECTVAPQPVGHAAGTIYRIAGSGSTLIVTYGSQSGFSSTRSIQFGTGSGLSFVGTYTSPTGIITHMGAAGTTWPGDPHPGGFITLDGVTVAIEIHNGSFLTSGGTWSTGINDITGLGLGQQFFNVSGVNNGSPLTRSFKAVGFCSNFMSQQDLDAVGLAIVPEPKAESKEWWLRDALKTSI
jgi:hypothetical protein